MSDLKNKDEISQTDPAISRTESDAVGQGSQGGRYVEQLEERIEEKDVVIGMLRGELAQRNDELIRRNERERETNILIRGLQNLVLQLQLGRSRSADVLQDDPLMTEREVSHSNGGPDPSPNAV